VRLGPSGERRRRQLLAPLPLFLWMWKMLPLAAFAGLRIVRLDDGQCSVRLPGGWRTKNPFRSTYFAAQAMAAELSAGAAAAVLVADAEASLSMLPLALRARYTKKLVGAGLFTFADVAGMRVVVERASGSDDPQAFTARPEGRDGSGDVVSEFEIDWSFKRRNRG
jgi:acyl-coenzyme A thioesterase PaaI-like protein